jgi:thiol-disulfide isomerase/thioredoxin
MVNKNSEMTKWIFVFGIGLLTVLWIFKAEKKESFDKNKVFYLNDTAANFNGLINKFKHKIVYVDIWATWCRPCVNELRQESKRKEFEEFASRNGIIILYVCSDRDEKRWKPFIEENDITGYHIMMNNHIAQDMQTTFAQVQRRNGQPKRTLYIPRHILIDQNGSVADSSAAAQGKPALYAEIKKMMGK